MKNKFTFGLLVILIVGITFLSGCAEEKTTANCGNGALDAGEECDGGGCSPGQECEDCKCVASEENLAGAPPVPQPPALPV